MVNTITLPSLPSHTPPAPPAPSYATPPIHRKHSLNHILNSTLTSQRYNTRTRTQQLVSESTALTTTAATCGSSSISISALLLYPSGQQQLSTTTTPTTTTMSTTLIMHWNLHHSPLKPYPLECKLGLALFLTYLTLLSLRQ
jgi:hypothetical protein